MPATSTTRSGRETLGSTAGRTACPDTMSTKTIRRSTESPTTFIAPTNHQPKHTHMNTTINAALVKALSELTNLAKDKVNPHFKSRFTSLDAILDATRPILAKHGLALSQEPVFEDGMAGVVTRIIHTSGESRESKLILPLRDQSAQGVGSAISYARRYSAAAVLGIASDEDDDGQQASTPSKAITKAVIAKPVIGGQPAREAIKPQDSLDTLFGLMDTNKVSEEEVRAFCLSKGMKDVPEFVADIKDSVAKRLVEIFSEVVEFSLNK